MNKDDFMSSGGSATGAEGSRPPTVAAPVEPPQPLPRIFRQWTSNGGRKGRAGEVDGVEDDASAVSPSLYFSPSK